jgi:hypothetical protein
MLPQTWERVVHVTRTHRFQGCTELVVQSTMKTNCQTPPNTIAALAGHRPPQETARGCWRGGPSGPPPTPDKEATSQGWSALLLRVISGGGVTRAMTQLRGCKSCPALWDLALPFHSARCLALLWGFLKKWCAQGSRPHPNLRGHRLWALSPGDSLWSGQPMTLDFSALLPDTPLGKPWRKQLWKGR